MSDDHFIPQMVPPQVLLPSPPDDVTEAATALRVACAKWAPHPGSSTHAAELQACDVVLNRDGQFGVGVSFGITCTLAAVWFVGACRYCVRDRAFSKLDDLCLYGWIAVLGAIGGIVVAVLLILRFGEDWSGAHAQLVFAGSGFVVTRVLAALRWNKQRAVAA